ncbi:MAG: SBBP repeat-containing protein [Polyangiaceae bacterium]
MRHAPFLSGLFVSLLVAGCGGESGSGGSAGSSGSAGTTSAGGTTASGGSGGSAGTTSAGGTTSSGGTGGATGGTGGSTGTPGECTPGAEEACYTGPSGTEGVGICKGGARTCKDDSTWGPCLGQVTPLTETCETPGDDDCDGLVNESGAMCVCVPGAMDPCYNGPPNTEGVGICTGGLATCAADGLSYGACEGQVLPGVENCLAPADEDCNGAALSCSGQDQFHKKFGDAGAQAGGGVAAWNGGAVVCGTFAGTVDFGGGNLVSGGGNDAFVASYDYLGAHQWSKRFGDAAAQSAAAIAVDPQGNVYVVGDNAGVIDPGGGNLTTAGLADVFLVKYDVNGVFKWAKQFGDNKAQNGLAVAAGADGRVAITGQYAGKMDFGGGVFTTAGGTDIFLAVFDTDGVHQWSKSFGDAAAQAGKGVAFGPQGEVILAADNSGVVDVGSGAALTTAGASDVVLASFDKNGATLWAKQMGNNVAQVANAVAVDEVGNVILGASFAGKINFGGGDLTSAGGNDIGLAKLTTGGMLLWGKRFGGTGADNARGVAVDTFGAVALAADFSGTVDFGGGNLVSAGGTDIVVARYDGLGAHVWSHRAGDGGAQLATAAAADQTGVFATGTFAGTVDFGGGALTSAGGNDVFLVKLSQ